VKSYYVLAKTRGRTFTGTAFFLVRATSRSQAIHEARETARGTNMVVTAIITAHQNWRETDV
jgi:hypothetical protein